MKTLKPMSGSSVASAFDGVTLRAVVELVGATQISSLGTEEQIERVFSRHAVGFEPTLNFCRRLGLVRSSGDSILKVAAEVPKARTGDFSEYLLYQLLRARNRYRSEVYRFLQRFKVKNGEVSYASPAQRRSQEQATRNFLMELKLVFYRTDGDEHVLSSQHVWVHSAARDSAGKTPPAALDLAMRSRNELGHAAEIAMMTFERKRVGPDLAGEVTHVALTNVAAGYDIRSITADQGSGRVPRYIEVKAVSPNTFTFYWSQREVDVAKVLGKHYYLYLLPVDRCWGFDLAGLKMVADPHTVVLGPSSQWTVEFNVLRCGMTADGRD